MISLYLLIACIAIVTGSLSPIVRMSRETFRFPIVLFPVEGNDPLNGFASLDIHKTFFAFTPNRQNVSQSNTSSIEARAILISENGLRVDFSHPINVYDEFSSQRNPSLVAGQWTSILISPESHAETIIVLQPSCPSDYAYERQIFYTPMLPSMFVPDAWWFRVAFRFDTTTQYEPTYILQDDFMVGNLSTSATDSVEVPSHLRREFMFRLVQELGIRTYPNNPDMSLRLEISDLSRLAELPSFDIAIRTDDGTEIQIAKLEPIDYLAPTPNPNAYLIFFGPSSGFTLTRRILQNLLIHIDYANQRVGFGDPLIEL